MFDKNFRSQAEQQLRPIGANINRPGLSADHLTAPRRACSPWARAVAIANGALDLAILLLFLTSVPDVLDGAVAKASGTASPRGAFFDSVADRFTDALLFGGVAWYLATDPARTHRRAAPRRPRLLHAHQLRAGQGRVARLRRPGRDHGAGRAPARPGLRPPVRLAPRAGALADARAHRGHRRAAVRVASGGRRARRSRPPCPASVRWRARRAARTTERVKVRRERWAQRSRR